MDNYLADTTVLVEMLRGNEQAKHFLEDQPAISAVTFAELIQGCRDKDDLLVVENTCKLLPQIKIDRLASELAIELLKKYYLSHGLIFLDALIAATAITRKKVLATENIKDFRFIEGLETIHHPQAFAR